MLSVIALLLLGSTSCPASKVEVHGVAEHGGTLTVYAGGGSASVKLVEGKKWSICVDSTDHGPIKPDGPYVPWFDEVHYAYDGAPARHERWAIPKDVKSLPVDKVVTSGVLK